MAFSILSNENIKLFDDSKAAVITQRTENETEKNIFCRQIIKCSNLLPMNKPQGCNYFPAARENSVVISPSVSFNISGKINKLGVEHGTPRTKQTETLYEFN